MAGLSLLGNRLAPVTSLVGFLESPFEQVRAAMEQWRRGLGRLRSEPTSAGLEASLMRLEPLTMPPSRELILETNGAWTAIFDNGSRGGDQFGPVGHLAQVLGCRGLVAGCSPRTSRHASLAQSCEYVSVIFELYGPQRTDWLNVIRSVRVTYDVGKWGFETSGEVQDFERPDGYRARRKRDRFPPERLADYCAALGVPRFRAEAYGPRGHLFRYPGRLRFGTKKLTLNDARARLGIV